MDESFLRRRTAVNPGNLIDLQVMSPTAPSGEIQGPNANDGEGVEGHQDLVPAMSAGPMGLNDQQNQGLANGVSPPERVGTGQSYGRSQALAASSQDQVPIQGAGLDFHRGRRASCPTSTSTLCNSFESNVWSNGSGHQAFASWCYDHHGCATSPSRFATRVSMAWGDSSQDNGECEAR